MISTPDPTAPPSLRLDEARDRAERLRVRHYRLHLDLRDDETFGSRTEVEFASTGGDTFIELDARELRSARLNGSELPEGAWRGRRLHLPTTVGENLLEVDAVMAYRTDGEGLHQHRDPADGERYLYQMSFMDAAPSVFACFDQPDLKAPYTVEVLTPSTWTVRGNGAAQQVGEQEWHLATTPPLSTYFVTLVAGPYHVIEDSHDGIGLGLSARRSIAAHLEREAPELFDLTRRCFDEFHRLFGVRYAFGDYHQAFVPEFNAGAMENPGCVTYRDQMVFTSRVTRGARIQRATTLAHEMAHQWFGNLVTPRWWDDLWLNESFAEYMGNRVTADATPYDDAWVHNAHARRQWGLIADQRPSTHPVAGNGAVDAAGALQDFDGISYVKGSSVLKQLAARLGDEVFLDGVTGHFARHRFGNATMHDLLASWQEAGADDLDDLTRAWLRTAGVDRIELRRDAGVLAVVPPAEHPAQRSHAVRVATAEPDGAWQVVPMTLRGDSTPVATGLRAAVVVDPYEDSWACAVPDEVTVRTMSELWESTTEPMLRAGMWNTLRSGVHTGALGPREALACAATGLPSETDDTALTSVGGWIVHRVLPVLPDAAQARALVHRVARECVVAAEPAGSRQLAALSLAVACGDDADELRAWLADDGLPEGVDLDEAVRWRLLLRLAELGEVDQAGLDAALAADPTAVARVEHARAGAARPDAEAKAAAWRLLSGEAPASNYEVEAAGLAFWQPGQEHLTQAYVERYFAALPSLDRTFSGWLLGDVAAAFFPLTSRTPATVERARAAAADPSLPGPVRRRVGDLADELERRLDAQAGA